MLFDSGLRQSPVSPQVCLSWDGSGCGQFSCLSVRQQAPATYCQAELRRGTPADWAKSHFGWLDHMLSSWTDLWGQDRRLELEVGLNLGQTIWLRLKEGYFPRELQILPPVARGMDAGQHMQMSPLPHVSLVVMSLFLLLFTPVETRRVSWRRYLNLGCSSHCQNQAQTVLKGNDSLSN